MQFKDNTKVKKFLESQGIYAMSYSEGFLALLKQGKASYNDVSRQPNAASRRMDDLFEDVLIEYADKDKSKMNEYYFSIGAAKIFSVTENISGENTILPSTTNFVPFLENLGEFMMNKFTDEYMKPCYQLKGNELFEQLKKIKNDFALNLYRRK